MEKLTGAAHSGRLRACSQMCGQRREYAVTTLPGNDPQSR